ncbi:TPA: autotransporter outer membrane beta-barrel domain-containing protein [Pseudomonas putida]|nr:autotransporter outer membrane beta-barrel domain-containing protein [Pseudomonas putida]
MKKTIKAARSSVLQVRIVFSEITTFNDITKKALTSIIAFSGALAGLPAYPANYTSTVRGPFTFTEDSTVTTSGTGAYGLYTTDGTSITSTGNVTVLTLGQNAGGINAAGGVINLMNANVTTSKAYAGGLLASNAGNQTSTINATGDVTVNIAGNYASAIRTGTNGYINLNNVNLTTTGISSNGLYATGKSSITITGTTTIRTSGNNSPGIYASKGSLSAHKGNIELGTVHITTTGNNSNGILTEGSGSVVDLNGGDIRTTGTNSHGFGVLGGASKTFDGQTDNVLPAITVSGDGSAVVASSGVNSKLTLAGNTALTMSSTPGINTWGAKAEKGGEVIFQGNSNTGGTGLWAADTGSSLTLSENADAAGSQVLLDEGTLYVNNSNQIGSLVGSAGSVVNAIPLNASLNLGSNNSTNDGSLIDNANFAGTFTNIGQLTKTGTLSQILSGSGNTVGSVNVAGGTLVFEQHGTFSTTGSYTTQNGATTDIGIGDSVLSVADVFAQRSGSTLKVLLDDNHPLVTAKTAELDGLVRLSGFVMKDAPVKASEITNRLYTLIHTTDGITGNFTNYDAAQPDTDYLLRDGHVSADGKDYNLGVRLAWTGGGKTQGTGQFTLATDSAFDIDIPIVDQTVPPGGFDNGWDGRSLTKDGDGLLVLSAVNSYSGTTSLNAGTLRTDAADSIAASNEVNINGGVLDLNGNNQQVNRLGGSGGEVRLNGAMLTVNNATSSDNTLYAGDIVDGAKSGGLTKTGDGSLTLTGKTLWTGDTRIDGGELVLDGTKGGAQLVSNIIGRDGTALSLRNGASLTGWIDPTDVNIDSGSRWNMTADSLVDDVNLAGTLNFVAPAASPMSVGRTLTTQNWNGQGGTVVLNTALGDDASVTDKIVVNGNTSGETAIKVNNVGGRGAQTVEGIRVVEVKGQSDGTFTQSGRIVAGVYDYSLVKRNADWYLTSQYSGPTSGDSASGDSASGDSVSVIRPEAGSYTANLAAANTMFITRLHDRLGETQYIDALTGEQKVTTLWLRQVGGHNRWEDSSGQLDTHSRRYLVQLGGEIAQWSPDGLQRLHLGMMAGYGRNSSNTDSNITDYHSQGTVSGYSAGLYATWYENDASQQGLYLDGWAQYGWFDNDVKGQDVQSESYDSSGITASLEAGYAHKLGELAGSPGLRDEWFIQPQMQVVWMGVKADDHRESNGTDVNAEGEGNLQTRLGVRTFLKGHGNPEDGKDSSYQPFVETNWIHNTQQFGTRMDGMSNYQHGARNIGELKTGIEGQLNQRLGLWGSVGVQAGDKGYSDTSAMLGVKYSF